MRLSVKQQAQQRSETPRTESSRPAPQNNGGNGGGGAGRRTPR